MGLARLRAQTQSVGSHHCHWFSVDEVAVQQSASEGTQLLQCEQLASAAVGTALVRSLETGCVAESHASFVDDEAPVRTDHFGSADICQPTVPAPA